MIKRIYELSMDEVKAALIDHCVKLAADSANVKELLESGGFHNFIPEVAKMNSQAMMDMFGDLDMGEPFAKEHKVDIVAIRFGDGYKMDILWDIENLRPEKRAEYQQ